MLCGFSQRQIGRGHVYTESSIEYPKRAKSTAIEYTQEKVQVVLRVKCEFIILAGKLFLYAPSMYKQRITRPCAIPLDTPRRGTLYINIHIISIEKKYTIYSCELEYFVETHLCKLCVILRSRILRVVCPH